MINTAAQLGPGKQAVRDLVKRAAFSVLGHPRLLKLRLDAIRRDSPLTILNFHRVDNDAAGDYPALDPELFDDVLGFLHENFCITTFGELAGRSREKPLLVLSFDDGYRDFIETAAPLLSKRRMRVNQNIVPECIESGLPPFNVLVAEFIAKAPCELVLNLDVPGFKVSKAEGLAVRVVNFIKNKSLDEQAALAEWILPQLFAWNEFKPTAMMSLTEVQEIASVHEVGGHSFSHASMGFETAAYLQNDVRKCQRYFREKLDRALEVYAFPNGSCAPGQAELVLDEGVSHVLLVGEAFSRGGPIHERFTFDARRGPEARYKALGRQVPTRPEGS